MANVKDRRCREWGLVAVDDHEEECGIAEVHEGVRCSRRKGHTGPHHAHGCILRWGTGDYHNLRREERLNISFIPRPGTVVVVSFDADQDQGAYDPYQGSGRIGDVAVLGADVTDLEKGDRVVFIASTCKFFHKGQTCYVVPNKDVVGKWSLPVKAN